MSQFDDLLVKFKENAKEIGITLDHGLLEKVAKGLGPSIYNSDSAVIACSNEDELATVKNNFLIKKLGLADGPELDSALKEVCAAMGSSNRNKHRAIFYTLLVEKFGKQAVYA